MNGAFAQWSLLNRLPALPAPPANVVAFINDCASLGPERVWAALCEISEAHGAHGYADPTQGAPVALVMSALSGIKPPRSWAKDARESFLLLPYGLQLVVKHREAERDKEIHRLFSQVAELKRAQSNVTV